MYNHAFYLTDVLLHRAGLDISSVADEFFLAVF